MKYARQNDRHFGYTLACVFLVIAGIQWWWTGEVRVWAVIIGVIFGSLAWLAPGSLMPLNRLWALVAPKIAVVNNTILLAAVFYLFVTPIGMIMRAIGRDPLHRRFDEQAQSYWTPVHRRADRESFSDQF